MIFSESTPSRVKMHNFNEALKKTGSPTSFISWNFVETVIVVNSKMYTPETIHAGLNGVSIETLEGCTFVKTIFIYYNQVKRFYLIVYFIFKQ